MPVIKINTRTVDALRAEGRPTLYWDTEVRRFGVRVQPGGRKVFVVQFERHGKSRRVTIGEYGRPWTVEGAKKQAQSIVGKVADGEPIGGGRRGLVKLNDVADDWLAKRVRPHRKARTIKDYEDKLRLYIRPKFGTAGAVAITRDDVVAWHSSMAETPRVANYALTVLSGVINFGIETGLIPKTHLNPASRIPKFEENSIERFLTRDEMGRIGDAIRSLEAEGKLSLFAAAALRLLIYTGARSGEIKSLRWDWVDLERATIFLPISKTGKKPVFLNVEALAVLRGLIRIKGNPHVIVGQREGEGMKSLRQPWAAVCDRAEIIGCRLHDLRHTFASFAVMGGLSLPEVGKLLGHKTPATTQRYAHLADSHARQNNDAVGGLIGSLLDGGRDASANVVRIGRRA